MMYGQMTAGLVDLHRQPGHRAGHLRDLRRGGPAALRRRLAGKWILTAGLGGMGGAQPLAATHGRRVDARHRMRAERASTCACRPATSTSRRNDLDEALAHPAAYRERRGRLDRAARQRRRDPAGARSSARRARGCSPTSSPTRPPRTILLNGYLPAGWSLEQMAAAAQARSRRSGARRRREVDRASTCRRCSTSRRWASRRVDYGNNIRQVAYERRREERLRLSRLRAGLHPAAVLRRQGAVPLGRAVGRSARTSRKTDAKVQRAVPGRPAPAPLARHGRRSASRFQGLPARICWLGLGERHRAGLAFNEMVKTRRAQGADRDRPRSPRHRLGREPQPRDRGDARRLRRGVRLAAAERAAEHRGRRHLGLASTTAAASAWATRSTPAW